QSHFSPCLCDSVAELVFHHHDRPEARIDLWMPELFGRTNGIQTYSAFLLEALQQIPLDVRLKCRIFLKHDQKYPDGVTRVPGFNYHFSGAWPLRFRTHAFAAGILKSGVRQRPHLIMATHLHFAAAAYWLKKL